jgi:hypothetical protein
MKVHRKRFTIMRTAAIAGCLAGLAVPSIAGADPFPAASQSGGDQAIAVRHENGPTISRSPAHTAGRPVAAPTAIGADTLSSQSKTTGVAAPSAIGADTLSSQSKVPAAAPVVRVVHTTDNSSDRTLAIVLASAALGIALCGAAFILTRVASIQRRAVGSSS